MASTPDTPVPEITLLERIGPKGWIRYILPFQLSPEYDINEVAHVIREGYKYMTQQISLAKCEIVPDKDVKQGGVDKLQLRTDDDFEDVFIKDLRDLSQFPWTYTELKEKSFPTTAFDERVYRHGVWPDPGGNIPVSFAQANFIRGGVLLNWCAFHMVIDGTSAHTWMKIWAEGCRRAQDPQLNSISDSMHIESHNEIRLWADREAVMKASGQNMGKTEDHPEYIVFDTVPTGGPPPKLLATNYRTTIFYFSPESMQRLKAESASQNATQVSGIDQKWVSTNDALSALIWRSLMAVQNPLESLEGDPISEFALAIDARTRMKPALHEDTIGSFTTWILATAPIRKILGDFNLADLALIIRKTVLTADDRFIDNLMTLVENLDDIGQLILSPFVDCPGLHVCQTTWAHSQFASLDWGSKLGHRLDALRVPVNGLVNGMQLVLPMLPDGGMEVLIGVEEHNLDRLLNEPGLREFAVPRTL
ncbi:uncharacterized protein N7483_005697 [Penicillium malachiteum]|uniref:uncharacterized protein n=1 Tax=Penicillium malachiteum TaxID=1324776 RepID=UPI0025484838|nr:uncharacterized protein N7483_005697 [Penicillium malachiteum]KAJ5731189.1 hypothetical protein N7483_005697 [Penicillium malachiteum]